MKRGLICSGDAPCEQPRARQAQRLSSDVVDCITLRCFANVLLITRAAEMSWQTYVDDHLLVPLPNGGQLSHAAIVGQDGGVWAQDAGFPAISVEEVQALVKGCNDTSMAQRFAAMHQLELAS